MLQAFEGMIDATGLCSFRQDGSRARIILSDNRNQIPFWAVVDIHSASDVLRELMAGNRRRALSMLEESAVSLGRILFDPCSKPNS